MKNYGFIKVVNITLENASAIEKMVNKAISDLNKQKIKILDLQITEDNIFLVLEPLWLVVQRWQDDEPKNSHCKKQKYPNVVPDHCLPLLFTHTFKLSDIRCFFIKIIPRAQYKENSS